MPSGRPAATAQLTSLLFTNDALRPTNHLASCVNCALLFLLLGFSPTRTATLVFLSASMLLAAARGYGGCETLAIPNWLFRPPRPGGLLRIPHCGQRRGAPVCLSRAAR
jgi:hypothetical protein